MSEKLDVNILCQGGGFWYLATPYSKHPGGIGVAFRDACEAAGHLIRLGVPVFCPIAHTHPIALACGIDPYDHGIWLPADLPFMESAKGLIVAKIVSWESSYGVREEIKFFANRNKPIHYMEWPN